MNILVLGGCGIQGRTTLYDLALDPKITRIICADIRFDDLDQIRPFTDMRKISTVPLDARDKTALVNLYNEADMVIDLLPKDFKQYVYEAALETGRNVVNTNYAHDIFDLDRRAKDAGIAIMPECGLDPGIDLVIYGDARRRFDTLTLINSYCGGFPEKTACTNPLNYKLSWIWRGVLSATKRSGRIIRDGRVVDVPGERQHDPEFIHSVDFPGLGTLEAVPNGDAVHFTDLLGVTETIRETGRYSLRWPGWSDFWRPMKALGFLDEEPVEGFDCRITPFDFLDKFLGPKLAYRDDEKDLTAMINVFEGLMDGKPTRLTSTMLIERDLETGIMAMSKGVGYTAAIVARMIASGEITEKGVLSPLVHIPVDRFMAELKDRGIRIEEKTTVLD
ncbi:MAG TPA: saccharopine dehydrogenase [Desulfobacteraceae bacterium]|nr:saccharopine dehydrogenase [Desulfobacteraceae bacterium]|tara:strand:+ start:189 stop:1361 length:1173 start_codon:yes stop_codon:yes gene_type:complete